MRNSAHCTLLCQKWNRDEQIFLRLYFFLLFVYKKKNIRYTRNSEKKHTITVPFFLSFLCHWNESQSLIWRIILSQHIIITLSTQKLVAKSTNETQKLPIFANFSEFSTLSRLSRYVLKITIYFMDYETLKIDSSLCCSYFILFFLMNFFPHPNYFWSYSIPASFQKKTLKK